MIRSILAVSAAALCLFGARTSAAQDTSTVGGSVGGSVSTGGDANSTSMLPKPTPPAAPAAPAAGAAAPEGPSDHEQVVGRFAVGYMGVSQVPVAGLGLVTAPFVGMRYWMSDRIGLDASLGLRTQSGSTEAVNGNATVTTEQPGVLVGGVKAGVPVALAYGKHFTFTIVPERLLAGGTSTRKQQGQPDTSRTGSRIELGARAGAEIQFGFIGVPQLSLQGSIGMNFARIATKQSQDTPNGTNSSATDSIAFGTTVQSDPWALFTNNIAALYYF